MPRPILRFVGPFLLILAGLACSSSDGPGQSVQAFYTHLNNGEYTEAMALYTGEALEVIQDPSVMGDGGFAEWAEIVTRNGSVSKVRILGSEIDDRSANVEYEVVYDDGSTEKKRVELAEEGGGWKLGLVG